MKIFLSRIVYLSVTGFAIGLVLWGIASVFAAGGHGTGLIYTIVFPWAQLLYQMDFLAGKDWPLLVICLAELPIYFVVIGVLWHKRRFYGLWGAAGIGLSHLIALRICLLPSSYFERFW